MTASLKQQGNSKFKDCKFDEAAALYTAAIELDQNDPALYSNRSASYLKLGRHAEALADARRRCTELKPGWAKGHYRTAAAHEAMGDTDAAMTAYWAALDRNPFDEDVISKLRALDARQPATPAAQPEDITFTVLWPGQSPDVDEEDRSPYVHLEDPSEDIEGMQDASDIVIPGKTHIWLAVDYPLRQEYVLPLRADSAAGFRRAELALKVSELYQQIYAAEEATAPDPGRVSPMLYNRGRSDGRFGIWGHDLGDLVLHRVRYDAGRDVCV